MLPQLLPLSGGAVIGTRPPLESMKECLVVEIAYVCGRERHQAIIILGDIAKEGRAAVRHATSVERLDPGNFFGCWLARVWYRKGFYDAKGSADEES